MKVIPFEEKYRQDFIAFNTDWIVSNFGCLEEHDIETFEKIDEQIAEGAMIFFAVENDTALATCMATPMEGTTWEICKLGSNKKIPHKGAGSAVFEAAMEWALCHGAERLFILSNSKLKPALHIYEKYGFQEIKLDNYEYTRGDIAFEYKKETAWDTKAVVKKEDAVKKVFQGVSLDSLAVGSKSQFPRPGRRRGRGCVYAAERGLSFLSILPFVIVFVCFFLFLWQKNCAKQTDRLMMQVVIY